jgi:peptidoglycan/xylan/chitin deacetylase (PgdA/CDA1 family)
MMHRVETGSDRRFGFYGDTTISPVELERYMAARSDWRPISHSRLRAAVEGELEEGNAYFLTCDDGYVSFATVVLPMLEKYESSCLLFVTTAFISGDLLPYEMVLADHMVAATEIEIPGRGRIRLEENSQREELYREIRLELKPARPSDRRDFVLRFLEANGLGTSPSKTSEFLSWEELKELARHPLVAIGAHTVSHPMLPALPLREAYTELRRSKLEIESRTGASVEAVAYPYGAHSGTVRALARLAGFRLGFTTRPGLIGRGTRGNRMALPRNMVGEGGA